MKWVYYLLKSPLRQDNKEANQEPDLGESGGLWSPRIFLFAHGAFLLTPRGFFFAAFFFFSDRFFSAFFVALDFFFSSADLTFLLYRLVNVLSSAALITAALITAAFFFVLGNKVGSGEDASHHYPFKPHGVPPLSPLDRFGTVVDHLGEYG